MKKEKPGIFYDSANLEDFKKWFDTGILGGATTNPVILKNDGVLDIPGHISKMIEICGKGFPISIELPDSTMTKGEMIRLALQYQNKFPHNAVIKVPMDPRFSQKAFEVMYKLAGDGVRVNATLGISAGQLIAAAEVLRLSVAPGDNYISLFWGRCEEARGPGGAAKTLTTVLKYLKTHGLAPRIIIGSIRNIDQIEEAFSLGADIVTIPPKLIEEWMFTKRGVETADEFNEAYRKVKDEMRLI